MVDLNKIARSTEHDLIKAESAWDRRRKATVIANKNFSLLSELQRSPTFFDGKSVFLVVCGYDINKEGEEGLLKASKSLEGDPSLDVFQDWPDLPPEGYLVCFGRGPRGGRIVFEGLFERRSTPADVKLQDSTLELCWRVEDIYGLKVGAGEVEGWRELIRLLWDSDRWKKSGGSVIINFCEIYKKLLHQ